MYQLLCVCINLLFIIPILLKKWFNLEKKALLHCDYNTCACQNSNRCKYAYCKICLCYRR